jgi:hypothetical protein
VLELGPLPEAALLAAHQRASASALAAFTARTLSLKDEPPLQAFSALASRTMQTALSAMAERNHALVRAECERKRELVEEALALNLDALARKLPVVERELRASIVGLEKMATQDFSLATARFDTFPAWRDVRDSLQAAMQERRQALELHNVERWTALVRAPLKRAKRLLEEVAPHYYLKWTLRRAARTFAEEFVADTLPGELKRKVVERWLTAEDDSGVGATIASRLPISAVLLAGSLLVIVALSHIGSVTSTARGAGGVRPGGGRPAADGSSYPLPLQAPQGVKAQAGSTIFGRTVSVQWAASLGGAAGAPAPAYELSFKAGAHSGPRGPLQKVAVGVTRWEGSLAAGVDRVAVRAAARNTSGASATSAWSADAVFVR